MSDYESHLRPHRGVFPLSELMDKSAADFGDLPVTRTWNGEEYAPVTYNELLDQVVAVASWLSKNGIGEGDHIAILGENRREWAVSYLAVQKAGAVCIPVDSMMPGPGIRHVLSDSESKMLFVSGKYLQTIEELEKIKDLRHVICFDQPGESSEALYYSDILEEGKKLEYTFRKRDMNEIAAVLYTSGTTGHSKGVMLSQGNIMSNVASAYRIFPIGPGNTFLSVLPIHHSFEATAGFLLPMYSGCCITYARSLKSNEIIEGIRETNVTFMVGVPLLYEKMQQGIMRGVRKKGKEKLVNTLFSAVKLGEKAGLKLGKTLFRSLREKGGLGSVRFFVSGGGPLDPETAFFFNRLGFTMMQGYGLTETSPVTHCNTPWQVDHLTVGPPIPDVECKLIDVNENGEGEVCIKGPNVFQGYYRNEEATKATFTEDGWFKTGDQGIIHPKNLLQITGRKKSMLVSGGGKNIYPEEIEFYLNRNPFIAESVVLGVPRDKGMGEDVGALIYPDYEQVDLHFEKQKKKPTPEDIYNLIKKEIKEAQKDLADYKRIRIFRIHDSEFQKTTKRTIKRFLYTGEMLKVNGEDNNE